MSEDEEVGMSFEDLAEEQVEEMFVEAYLWVVENRPEWIKKAEQRRQQTNSAAASSKKEGEEN